MKAFKVGCLAMIAAAMVAWPAFAYRVEPLQYVLTPTGQGAAARIRVQNTHATPINLELQAFRVAIDEAGKRTLTPDKDSFVMFPPQATLKAGVGQAFQVRYVGEPNVKEGQIYIVRVHQLNTINNPIATGGDSKGNVALSFNFNTTAIVEPARLASPVEIIQNLSAGADGKMVAKVVNRGPGVADLSGLIWKVELAGKSRQIPVGELTFGETTVLAPGATRIVGFPASVNAAAKLSVSER